jgi:hypothetical protein
VHYFVNKDKDRTPAARGGVTLEVLRRLVSGGTSSPAKATALGARLVFVVMTGSAAIGPWYDQIYTFFKGLAANHPRDAPAALQAELDDATESRSADETELNEL